MKQKPKYVLSRTDNIARVQSVLLHLFVVSYVAPFNVASIETVAAGIFVVVIKQSDNRVSRPALPNMASATRIRSIRNGLAWDDGVLLRLRQ